MLNDIGYTNVVHENADFYGLITRGDFPRHDVLVTNPPYSEDHIGRLLDYVVSTEIPIHERPVCLLLPNWVSRKAEYESTFVAPLTSMGFELLYLGPLVPYKYAMPSFVTMEERPDHVGTNGETMPYLSSWYMVVPPPQSDSRRAEKYFMLDMMDGWSRKRRTRAWVVARTVRGFKWKMKKVRSR
jgi:hypothetical protein